MFSNRIDAVFCLVLALIAGGAAHSLLQIPGQTVYVCLMAFMSLLSAAFAVDLWLGCRILLRLARLEPKKPS